MTPLKAIRAKCLDCMCGQVYEVRKCPVNDCSLWPYRMGHRPAKESADENTPEKPGVNRGNQGILEGSDADAIH